MRRVQGRLRHIDALRGIAALAVLTQHIAVFVLNGQPYGATLARVAIFDFDLGRFGVVLFFLVSGFVIPVSAAKTSAREFCITRAFRLYPAFWLSILVVPVIAGAGSVSPRAFLANMTMAPRLFGQAPLIDVYWTLFVELAFYVLLLAMKPPGYR